MALLSPSWTYDVVVLFSVALVGAYFYMTRHFGHWKRKGVMELPPIPFVGNFGNCLIFRLATFELLKLLYKQGKGLPYIGFYICDKPALVLRDLEIIKTVLIKDFNCFRDRYVRTSKSDVLGYNNLFLIENPAWKKLRSKLTSTFSSGKMRAMYTLIDAVGDELTDLLDSLDLEGDGLVLDIKDLCAGYTTDTIATCAFGLQVSGLKDPNSAFRAAGRKSWDFSYRRGIELMSLFFLPGLAKLIGFKFFGSRTSEFQREVFFDAFNERYRSGLKRNDLIDLLIELKDNPKEAEELETIKFDDDILVAQAAIFFAAGFETSATVLSFTLHELSLHPNIQTRLRDEITTALEDNDGKLSYDVLQKLPYLDRVVSEGLRKYPSLSFLDRVARSDYTLSKTGLVIEKGTPIYVPLLGLHYDPEYYPNPDEFDPERFNEENERQRPPFVYLPFGDGPHSCIGLRFGLMQVKTGIVKILTNYELSSCEKTCHPICFDPKGFTLRSQGGLYHSVRKI